MSIVDNLPRAPTVLPPDPIYEGHPLTYEYCKQLLHHVISYGLKNDDF